MESRKKDAAAERERALLRGGLRGRMAGGFCTLQGSVDALQRYLAANVTPDVYEVARTMLDQMTGRIAALERVSGKFPRRVSRYSAEERLALALDFLARHPYMRVVDYAVMTGLSRTVAGRELRRLYQTPGSGIGISGMGTHRVYVRVKPIEEP